MSTPNSLLRKNSNLILAACVAAVYLVVVLTVSGTRVENDVNWFTVWQQQARHLGMAATYAYANLVAAYPGLKPLNYPPLYLYILTYLPLPAGVTGLLVCVPFFYLVYRKTSLFQIVVLLAMPVTVYSVLVAGQIDYLEISLLIVSVLFFEKGNPWLAGIIAGLSLALKDEAIVFIPVFAAMAWRDKRYLYAFLPAFAAVFLPLYAHLPLVLKVSYLNNMGLFHYMTLNGPNLWSLFVGNLKQPDTVFWRYVSYLLAAIWAVYMFWRHKDSGDWLAFCYYMAVGFLFWPTQSQMRHEIYPFAFAYYLWKVNGRQEFVFPTYLFGISGGILVIMLGLNASPFLELIFVKGVALVTGWLVYDIVRRKVVPRREKGDERCDKLLEKSLLPYGGQDACLPGAGSSL